MFCSVSPMPAPGRIRSAWSRLGLIALTLVVAACAAPISVTRVDPRDVHRELTRNVLSAGEPSTFSQIVINRADLHGKFDDDPEGTLWILHGELATDGRISDQLFALAELSFLHAERSRKQAYYLAAAVYAYAFLFPPLGEASVPPYDPRFREVCDLYNRAITAAFRSPDGAGVELRAGVWPLPFGELDVAFDPTQLTWVSWELAEFVPVAELEVKGLRSRYRRPGIGAPLAASIVPRGVDQSGLRVPPGLKVPVTAFLRLENPRRQLATEQLQARLELYVASDIDTVQVGMRRVPLEGEPTAALAYMLSRSQSWDLELSGFLFGDLLRERKLEAQLFALEPYRPGRIPVVFVHGTASSPMRWAEMLNELQNDPRIANRYQFWFFTYETGNPILYSAMRLRESLERAVATLDPDGKDPALRQMVIMGHSQGGLLTKLMVVELETQIRETLLSVPIEDLHMSEESRDMLRRSIAVHPLPFVRTVIFLATPHRGSYVAGNWLAHQLARLVRLPATVLQATGDILTQDPRLALVTQGRMTSVAGMTPGSPLVTLLAPAPLAPGVAGHSVIAVSGERPLEEETDGVVAYSSAHLDGMASELVVHSGHSVQQDPVAIEDVRRILLEHGTRP
jgi:pimeloyl-ACP methyl ester carboxylesterase